MADDRTDLQAALIRLCGADAVIADAAGRAGYEHGARYGAGRAALVVRPADTGEVAAVLAECHGRGIHVVPQGANTGLVAAGTPDGSGTQVVLSLERLRAPIAIDPVNRSVLVGAGVRLSALNEKLAEHGLTFPIDLGADPSIGGMIATNTGGSRLIRYGDVRRNLLGLEVVLPDGTVVEALNALRKNNTGVDLKQLFVGTAGAFGVVTRAVLEVHPLPARTATALIVPRDPEAVATLLADAEAELGDVLCAFEGMSKNAMECALRHRPGLRNPFAPGPVPHYALLVELASRSADLPLEEMLENFVAARLEDDGTVADAVLGHGEAIWALRHGISDSLRDDGKVIAFDISLPRSAMEGFRTGAIAALAERWPFLKVCDFGHRGDGGDHFNIVWPNDAAETYDPAVVAEVRRLIYDRVVRDHGGSFSAEHGIGPYNQAFYHAYVPAAQQRLAGSIKELLDRAALLGTVDFGPAGGAGVDPVPGAAA